MDKITIACPLCYNRFQHGPHIYEGKRILRSLGYKITVCSRCHKDNFDGWEPLHEQRLIDHLKKEGLPIPDRNEKGWLPRD